MKCPKCGSEKCEPTTRLEAHNSKFDWINACCGSICLGPLGLLCGLCGTGTTIKEKNIWKCTQCGTHFTNLEGAVYDVMDSESIGDGVYKIFEKLGPFAVVLIIFLLLIIAMLMY